MSDYLKRARSAFETFLRPRPEEDPQGTGQRAATGPAASASGAAAIDFTDPAIAARSPAAWLELFRRAVAEDRPIADASLRIVREALGCETASDRSTVDAIRFLVSLPGQQTLSGE